MYSLDVGAGQTEWAAESVGIVRRRAMGSVWLQNGTSGSGKDGEVMVIGGMADGYVCCE